jgi:hypothetical protein
MQEKRFVLVTSLAGAPVYTNGHKFTLRRSEGHWRVNAIWFSSVNPDAREKLAERAARQLDQDVRWQPYTGAPIDLDNVQNASPGCLGCNARESVIRELIDALVKAGSDLKSNKFKRAGTSRSRSATQ